MFGARPQEWLADAQAHFLAQRARTSPQRDPLDFDCAFGGPGADAAATLQQQAQSEQQALQQQALLGACGSSADLRPSGSGDSALWGLHGALDGLRGESPSAEPPAGPLEADCSAERELAAQQLQQQQQQRDDMVAGWRASRGLSGSDGDGAECFQVPRHQMYSSLCGAADVEQLSW